MEWEKVVGQNIRNLRLARGMTQERLALEASIDLRYLGGIERGEQNPSLGVLVLRRSDYDSLSEGVG